MKKKGFKVLGLFLALFGVFCLIGINAYASDENALDEENIVSEEPVIEDTTTIEDLPKEIESQANTWLKENFTEIVSGVIAFLLVVATDLLYFLKKNKRFGIALTKNETLYNNTKKIVDVVDAEVEVIKSDVNNANENVNTLNAKVEKLTDSIEVLIKMINFMASQNEDMVKTGIAEEVNKIADSIKGE